VLRLAFQVVKVDDVGSFYDVWSMGFQRWVASNSESFCEVFAESIAIFGGRSRVSARLLPVVGRRRMSLLPLILVRVNLKASLTAV
jgi:hypothetical protein